MENKSKPAKFQPLSYASALRGKQGVRIEAKPKPAPAPAPKPTTATTPTTTLRPLTATAPAWKPIVKQPSPAVPDHRHIEQAKSARLTNPTPAPRESEFPQLSQAVAKPKLAAVSYAQAVTGKRTPAPVIAKQQSRAPQGNPIRAEGDDTTAEKTTQKGAQKGAQKGVHKDAQKDGQKDGLKDGLKDGQKDAQKDAQKGPKKSPKKNQKKSPKKKKKNNTNLGANTAIPDSTIKEQPIPQHPEKKAVARTERGPTAHQHRGLPSENTSRSNIAGKAEAGGASTPRKYADVIPHSQSPSIPPRTKDSAWKLGGSDATSKARQRSSTFSGFDFSLHPNHNQSHAPTASNLLCHFATPLSTSFAAPLFAKHIQDNHIELQTRFPSKVFSSTMPRFVIPPKTQGVCPRPGLQLISGPRPSTARDASSALGSDDFSIHCDEPGFEGMWPKAVRQQKRIIQLIRKHDNKEIDLFKNPKSWDMQIVCGDRAFYVHRRILLREYTRFHDIARYVILDGRCTRLELDYTTPARMANVLAFLYDKDIMKTDRFLPKADRPLNGAVILNNTLAVIASLETGCRALNFVADAHIEIAVRQAMIDFTDRADAYQSAVDDAMFLDTPAPEFSSFISEDELASFYKPYRIAVQAMKDTADFQPTLWREQINHDFRAWMACLAEKVFAYLLWSKKFREEELPKWEENGLVQFMMNDVRTPRRDTGAEAIVVRPVVEGFE
ncbi:hypothetical protein B0T20DRAFT_357920 [Sordaria brevicollis]|uniref:BTB domain-containing protein n=1 Tax=Sordaria brevicollis TaxID=83679 RepID=A0AAE0PAC6_SORBR|nr:hypothetical protein B0T20DRAFT_357920 [Sordaria brevicollis]